MAPELKEKYARERAEKEQAKRQQRSATRQELRVITTIKVDNGTTAETIDSSSASERTNGNRYLKKTHASEENDKHANEMDKPQEENDHNEGVIWDKVTSLLGLVEDSEEWLATANDEHERDEILMKYYDISSNTTRMTIL
eukprot:3983471-Amphidinium_carterae.1